MSLFKRIFGGLGSSGNPGPATALTVPKESRPEATIFEGFLTVKSPRFMGLAELSPNKQWAASFNNQGGGRWVVLCDAKRKQVQHMSDAFITPMAVAVADTGVLLVNDALVRTELSGAVAAFKSDGTEIFRRTYRANVYAMAISPCGNFACAQTANSQTDGNLLEAFDLKAGQVLFSVHPETEWATAYRFEVSDGVLLKLHVGSKPSGPYAYSATGEFLDKARQIQAGLEGGPPGFRIGSAETVLGDPSSSSTEKARALQTLDDVAQEMRASSPDWAAKALRAKGEALEKAGHSSDAIAAYEAALALDPKAGVKKRLSALQKAAK